MTPACNPEFASPKEIVDAIMLSSHTVLIRMTYEDSLSLNHHVSLVHDDDPAPVPPSVAELSDCLYYLNIHTFPFHSRIDKSLKVLLLELSHTLSHG